jgi:uncharacterized protein (DUF1684 family)
VELNEQYIMRKISIASILILFSLAIFGPANAQKNFYLEELKQWDGARIAALKDPNGWLNLEGLFWFKKGVNSFGSASTNDLVYDNAAFPKHLGDFIYEDGKVYWKDGITEKILIKDGDLVQNSETLNLLTATEGKYISRWKDFAWIVIQREDKVGVRFRNLKAKTLLEFKGIERFPVDTKWRIKAKVIPQNQNPLMIMNVLGQNTAQKHGGQLIFEIDGKTYRLDAIDEGGQRLFVAFADATSGKTTYGSGRFIELEKPDAEGFTYIDFNKAYNPPCAFTEFATCPLPPPQNRLSIAIPAGEKKYGHH